MGLVLEIVCDECIVVRVLLREPCYGVYPVVEGDGVARIGSVLLLLYGSHILGGLAAALIVPELVVVTRVVRGRAVNVHERLYAVLLALLHYYVKDLHAVHLAAVGVAEVGIELEAVGVLGVESLTLVGIAVHPREQELGRNGEANDVDAVVGYGRQEVVDIRAPQTVREVLGAVHAEPVGSREPYLIAVHVIELAALCMEPVVVAVIDRNGGYCRCCCRRQSRTDCRYHNGGGRHKSRERPCYFLHDYYPSRNRAEYFYVSVHYDIILTS